MSQARLRPPLDDRRRTADNVAVHVRAGETRPFAIAGLGPKTGILLLLLVGGCVSSESAGDAPASGSSTEWRLAEAQIVFTGRRDGTADIYLFDSAVGATTRLTHFGAPEGGANAPRPSPDGSALAFQVRRGQDYEIHVLDLATNDVVNVSRHPEFDVSPVWSPDGTEIAFMSTRGYELGSIGPFPGHIYVFHRKDRSLRQLTGEPLTSSLGPSDWSTDGATLLLARVVDGRPAVFSIAATSGAETPVTSGFSSDYSATYSHAGDRIAFHSEADGESHIVVAAVDGSGRRVLTSGAGLRYYPRWSPDDEWLVFTASDDGEDYDIRAVNVRDGRVVDLVSTAEDEREAAWVWPTLR